MAAPRLLSLSRTLFTTASTTASTTTKTLTSLLSRPFSSSSFLLRLRPLASTVITPSPPLRSSIFRSFSSNKALSDGNTNWSNRPPKETILLDGCDFEHWLVVVETPPENLTRDEIIDSYIKTLAQIVGSEDEARMKIYSVSTRHYFAFGALVSEELSLKLKELPNVRWVLPDSYLDVRNKDYGGEPFINGQAVPYDPKYHEEWVRNNAKAQERNRRNDRPRNADRSRNFERRQQTRNPNPGPAGAPAMGGPGGNMGGPSNYQGGAPPNNPGYAQNMPPNNPGYAQNMPPNNPGYAQNMPPNNPGFAQNMPPSNPGFAQNMPPNNAGYAPNYPGNPQNMPPSNAGYPQSNYPNEPRRGGGPPFNYGGQGNPSYGGPNYQQGGGMPHQNAPVGNQNYAPYNSNTGAQPGGAHQPQDVPGRDVPNY